MPLPLEKSDIPESESADFPDYEAVRKFNSLLQASIKEHGFPKTLKEFQRFLAKKSRPVAGMYTVTGGDLELTDKDVVDAVIHTKEGARLLVEGKLRPEPLCDDIQATPQNNNTRSRWDELLPAASLLDRLVAAEDAIDPQLIFEVEFSQFDLAGQRALLPLLWKYIVDRRMSQNPDELLAVGSAIRKYVALMPIDQMGELSVLLATANHEPLPLELELEVAKMIYRNFEVSPPVAQEPHPELADQLFEMAATYTRPRMLLRGKHSAVASLAIEALVAMRSGCARAAWQLAIDCRHGWFGEMVSDDLLGLQQRWRRDNRAAADWLNELRNEVIGNGEPYIAEHARK